MLEFEKLPAQEKEASRLNQSRLPHAQIRPNLECEGRQNTAQLTAPVPLNRAEKRVENYRLLFGWLTLLFWLVSAAAFDLDSQWHLNVGRDGFWTPPHLLFYTSLTICGIICLFEILVETSFYYRGYRGINSSNTTRIFLIFRGPQGFILSGFGLLVMLVSAPLDDYWHRIYGIDVRIWSPFHVMLLLGAIIGNVGLIYLFASQLNLRLPLKSHEKAKQLPRITVLLSMKKLLNPALLGLILAFLALMTRYLFLMSETEMGSVTLLTLKLPAYSIILIAIPTLLTALTTATRIYISGIATLSGLLLALLKVLDWLFTNWGINTLAIGQGLKLRAGLKDFTFVINSYPDWLIVAGIVVDIIYFVSNKRGFRSERITSICATVGASLVLFITTQPWEIYNHTLQMLALQYPTLANTLSTSMIKLDYWPTLIVILPLGCLGGLLGLAFGTALRYSER